MYGEAGDGMGNGFVGFLPYILISVPLAIGYYKVAEKLGREKTLWALLSLVPIVNFFFWIYAWFVVVLFVLDRLNAIEARLSRSPA